MTAIKVFFGIICGAIAGFSLGIAIAATLGWLSTLADPTDPTAGSVAIVFLATAPIGLMAGAAFGGLAIVRRPRLFYLTFFPLAILGVALLLILKSLDF